MDLEPLRFIASWYLGLQSDLTSFKVWRTFYTGESERAASQIFHRNFNDRHVVRAFLYFGPVTIESGAGQFVAGSQRGGRFEGAFADRDENNSAYADDAAVEKQFENDIVTAEGGIGDIYIIDTSGLHRGGYHTEDIDRRVALFTYSSAADLEPSYADSLRA